MPTRLQDVTVAPLEAEILIPQRGLCPQNLSVLVECSAKGAGYESQGQARSASPLVTRSMQDQGLKGRNRCSITPFQGWVSLIRVPGATRCALAPGFHIPRLWRWITYTPDFCKARLLYEYHCSLRRLEFVGASEIRGARDQSCTQTRSARYGV